MNGKDLVAGVIAVFGHLFAWIAQTEEIWMSVAGVYIRYIAPELDVPDLRGPFLFLTMVYIGLRLADLWNERNELEDTL